MSHTKIPGQDHGEPADRHAISEAEVARAWDDNAENWAEQVRNGGDVYRLYFNNPAFLVFAGDLKDKTVLDAGCGEGYNTRILAGRGARLTGVDISPRMIELAREQERREPLGIRYEVASFTDLAAFADGSFDAVVSFMALMDGPGFEAAMREFYRVLRPAGILAFSIIHPCFQTKGFGWIHDESGKEIALRVAHYFDDTPWVERWRFSHTTGDEPPAPFAVPRFDRTLSYYINGMLEAGFALNRIAEPRPTEEACRKHPYFRRWREHVPLFLHLRAEKPR